MNHPILVSKCFFLLGRSWIRVGISADLPIELFDQMLSFSAELEPTIQSPDHKPPDIILKRKI